MTDPNGVFTTKRTVNQRTKQIETRIQRQIVIEDGKVVSDTGPQVTTKTLEDSKQEVEQIEQHCTFTGAPSQPVSERAKASPQPAKPQKFMFGYNAQQSVPKNESQSHSGNKVEDRFVNQHAKSWHTPRKYFYFGQNTNQIDIKEKENLQLNDTNEPIKVKSTKKNQRKMSNASNDSGSTGEKDCQFAYEYSDFSRQPNNRF